MPLPLCCFFLFWFREVSPRCGLFWDIIAIIILTLNYSIEISPDSAVGRERISKKRETFLKLFKRPSTPRWLIWAMIGLQGRRYFAMWSQLIHPIWRSYFHYHHHRKTTTCEHLMERRREGKMNLVCQQRDIVMIFAIMITMVCDRIVCVESKLCPNWW